LVHAAGVVVGRVGMKTSLLCGLLLEAQGWLGLEEMLFEMGSIAFGGRAAIPGFTLNEV
jgi:hypothetical protein